MKTNHCKHYFYAKTAALLAVVALSLALSLAVQAQESTPPRQLEGKLLEEVVVTGIRSSVADALQIKRQETGIVDAISADDIASFPDENIAESIQRIPGIQIERANGRGALISIRGLGPEYAATTLNGQAFASAQFTGGFRYDIVQSELASAIQVYKTPSAAVEEGGLAGTVNINTAKPLAFDERKILLRAEGVYSKDPDSTTPSGSITYIDQFNDGKVGLLLNVGFQELDTRYDLLYSQRFSEIDDNGDGSSDLTAGGIPLERTNRPRLRREDGNTKRYLFNGALQFFPSDNFEVNLTGVLAQDERRLNFQQLVPLFGGGTPAPVLTELGRTGPTVDHLLAENIRIEANHTLQTEDRTSYALTADAEWVISDSWTAHGILHYTAGDIDIVERAIVLGIRSDLEVNLGVSDPVFISNRLNPVADPDSWAPQRLFRNDLAGKVQTYETDELAVQFDIEYAFAEASILSAFKTGIKHRAQTLDTINNRFGMRYRGERIFTAPFPTVAAASSVVRDFSAGEFPGLSVDFVLPDVDAYLAAFDASGTVVAANFQEADFFEIERDITTLYGQLDFAAGQLRGNVGLRYAHTDRQVDTVNFDGGLDVTLGAFTDVGGDSGVPVSNGFDYDNWLPSLNLAFDLTDDIVLRAAAGKVLVRPIIGATATFGRKISAQEDGTDVIVTVAEGSFNLPALTAKQFDLSAEWYFADAGALSIAYFHKDVSNQVRGETVCPADFALTSVTFDPVAGECVGSDDGFIYNITRNRTTRGTLELNGVEFAYSQSFDFLPAPFDGLGVIANYTILDANNPAEDQPLLGSSEDTYNLIGYYEKGDFSGRLAFNHRSAYSQQNGFSGETPGSAVPNPGRRLEARNQIDISLSYTLLNDVLKFTFEGINVNGDFERGTRFVSSRLQSVATFGPTYFFGVRYSL